MIYRNKYSGIRYFCFADNSVVIKADQIDLTGLTNPIPIEIQSDNILVWGEAEISESEQVAFMNAYADTLQVTKAKVKAGQKANSDTLTVEGKLAAADTSVDLSGEEVVIGWAGQTFTLPAGSFGGKGAGKYVCKKAAATEGGVVSAVIDWNQSAFKMVVTDAAIRVQSGAAEFGLAFGSFEETAGIMLP